jgi:hypothetical protein
MARSQRLVAGLAIFAVGLSALAYAAWPVFPVVLSAAVLHSAASCVLGPAIAASALVWSDTRLYTNPIAIPAVAASRFSAASRRKKGLSTPYKLRERLVFT